MTERIEAAQDRIAAGQREEAVAEYRRALALNPADRIALDAIEQTLRTTGRPELLAEHLAFRDTVPPTGIPTTLVIGRNGRIAARVIGEVSYPGLHSLITKALAQPA